jgi:L-histidine Nalpha-methyltransferase
LSRVLNISDSFTEEIISDRLSILKTDTGIGKSTFAEEVLLGLTSVPKGLHPKYFYDSKGSELFEQICETPEYYVTRTESSILEKYSDEIAMLNSDEKAIVELGSGSSIKTKYILNSFIKNSGSIDYYPIDVSEIMVESSKALLSEFEGLSIRGINSEYEQGLKVISGLNIEPKCIIFFGSSIGNFKPSEASGLLNAISGVMTSNDSFLIGFDLVKDFDILNAAYNDSQGITAGFNLNILQRINNELGGTFDLGKFLHRAFFNSTMSRIEMHLESQINQTVYIEAMDEYVYFKKGETIHTENSYKFTDKLIDELAASAGLKAVKRWKDSNNWFELCLMKKMSEQFTRPLRT